MFIPSNYSLKPPELSSENTTPTTPQIPLFSYNPSLSHSSVFFFPEPEHHLMRLPPPSTATSVRHPPHRQLPAAKPSRSFSFAQLLLSLLPSSFFLLLCLVCCAHRQTPPCHHSFFASSPHRQPPKPRLSSLALWFTVLGLSKGIKYLFNMG